GSSTGPPTNWASTPWSRATTSPTCTPRCCTCWASTRAGWRCPAASAWRSTAARSFGTFWRDKRGSPSPTRGVAMDDMTRRGALAVAATAGVAALAAADDKKEEKPKEGEKPRTAMTDKDRALDRERVLACGMTEAEADCWEAVATAAGKFFDLPKLHVMDDHE